MKEMDTEPTDLSIYHNRQHGGSYSVFSRLPEHRSAPGAPGTAPMMATNLVKREERRSGCEKVTATASRSAVSPYEETNTATNKGTPSLSNPTTVSPLRKTSPKCVNLHRGDTDTSLFDLGTSKYPQYSSSSSTFHRDRVTWSSVTFGNSPPSKSSSFTPHQSHLKVNETPAHSGSSGIVHKPEKSSPVLSTPLSEPGPSAKKDQPATASTQQKKPLPKLVQRPKFKIEDIVRNLRVQKSLTDDVFSFAKPDVSPSTPSTSNCSERTARDILDQSVSGKTNHDCLGDKNECASESVSDQGTTNKSVPVLSSDKCSSPTGPVCTDGDRQGRLHQPGEAGVTVEKKTHDTAPTREAAKPKESTKAKNADEDKAHTSATKVSKKEDCHESRSEKFSKAVLEETGVSVEPKDQSKTEETERKCLNESSKKSTSAKHGKGSRSASRDSSISVTGSHELSNKSVPKTCIKIVDSDVEISSRGVKSTLSNVSLNGQVCVQDTREDAVRIRPLSSGQKDQSSRVSVHHVHTKKETSVKSNCKASDTPVKHKRCSKHRKIPHSSSSSLETSTSSSSSERKKDVKSKSVSRKEKRKHTHSKSSSKTSISSRDEVQKMSKSSSSSSSKRVPDAHSRVESEMKVQRYSNSLIPDYLEDISSESDFDDDDDRAVAVSIKPINFLGASYLGDGLEDISSAPESMDEETVSVPKVTEISKEPGTHGAKIEGGDPIWSNSSMLVGRSKVTSDGASKSCLSSNVQSEPLLECVSSEDSCDTSRVKCVELLKELKTASDDPSSKLSSKLSSAALLQPCLPCRLPLTKVSQALESFTKASKPSFDTTVSPAEVLPNVAEKKSTPDVSDSADAETLSMTLSDVVDSSDTAGTLAGLTEIPCSLAELATPLVSLSREDSSEIVDASAYFNDNTDSSGKEDIARDPFVAPNIVPSIPEAPATLTDLSEITDVLADLSESSDPLIDLSETSNSLVELPDSVDTLAALPVISDALNCSSEISTDVPDIPVMADSVNDLIETANILPCISDTLGCSSEISSVIADLPESNSLDSQSDGTINVLPLLPEMSDSLDSSCESVNILSNLPETVDALESSTGVKEVLSVLPKISETVAELTETSLSFPTPSKSTEFSTDISLVVDSSKSTGSATEESESNIISSNFPRTMNLFLESSSEINIVSDPSSSATVVTRSKDSSDVEINISLPLDSLLEFPKPDCHQVEEPKDTDTNINATENRDQAIESAKVLGKESRPPGISSLASDIENVDHGSPTKLTTPLEICDTSPDTKAVVPPEVNNILPEASATSSGSLLDSDRTNQTSLVGPSNKFLFQIGKEHHMKLDDGQKLFACDICSGVYQRAFSLKRHYLRSHINYRYLTERDISNCGIITGDKMALESENNTKICMQNSKITAVSDSENSRMEGDVLVANTVLESKTEVASENKPIPEGGISGEQKDSDQTESNKTDGTSDPLQDPLGLYRCHTCGNCFEEKTDLKLHLTNHPVPPVVGAGGEVKTFTCTRCNATFSHKNNYLRHCASEAHNQQPVIVNTGIKKTFMCLYCNKEFTSAAIRKRHQSRIHQSQKKLNQRRRPQHVCPFCTKPKKFRELNLLMKHCISAHLDEYHVCTVCLERFQSKDILNDHVKAGHTKAKSKAVKISRLLDDASSTISTDSEIKEKSKEESAPSGSPLKQKEESVKPEKVNPPEKKKTLNRDDSTNKEPVIPESNFRHKCNVCQKMFTNNVNLSRHNRLAHGRAQSSGKKSKKGSQNSSCTETLSSTSDGSRSQSPLTTGFVPVSVKKSLPKQSQATPRPVQSSVSNSRLEPNVDERAMDPETLFYSRLSCNIRDNLLNHLDGKLHSRGSVEHYEESACASREVNSRGECSSQNANVISESSPSNADILLDDNRTGKKSDAKERSPKRKPAAGNPAHKVYWEKYNFPKNYDGKGGGLTSYIKDMSHLDIHTQLTMRQNLQRMNSNSSDSSEDMPLSRMVRNEDSSRNNVINFPAELRLMEKVSNKPSTRSSKSAPPSQSSKKTRRLTRRALELEQKEREAKSNSSSRRGSTEEGPANTVVLSGEWVRPRSYVCAACSERFVDLWDLEDHKYSVHPNVWCTHFEFDETSIFGTAVTEDQSSSTPPPLPVDLCRRYLLSDGALQAAKTIPVTVASDSKCTKCGRAFHTLPDLHRHMLECGGDTTWMLTMLMTSPGANNRRNRRWRPFGSRRRRQQGRRGMKRNIPSTPIKLPHYRPRHRANDSDTIQRMIANLPAKRATRRAIQFSEDEIKTRSQSTIHSVPFAPNLARPTYKGRICRSSYGRIISSPERKHTQALKKRAVSIASGATPSQRAKARKLLRSSAGQRAQTGTSMDLVAAGPSTSRAVATRRTGKLTSRNRTASSLAVVEDTNKSLVLSRGRSVKRLTVSSEIRSMSTGPDAVFTRITRNVQRSMSLDQTRVMRSFPLLSSVGPANREDEVTIDTKGRGQKAIDSGRSKASRSRALARPGLEVAERRGQHLTSNMFETGMIVRREASSVVSAMKLALMEKSTTITQDMFQIGEKRSLAVLKRQARGDLKLDDCLVEENPIQCGKCGIKFPNPSACERHKKKCVVATNIQLCHHCGKSFAYTTQFWRHIKVCSTLAHTSTANLVYSQSTELKPADFVRNNIKKSEIPKRSASSSPIKKKSSKAIAVAQSQTDDKMPELEKVQPIEAKKRVTRSKRSNDIVDIPVLSPAGELIASESGGLTDSCKKINKKGKTIRSLSESRLPDMNPGELINKEIISEVETLEQSSGTIKRSRSRTKQTVKLSVIDKKLNTVAKKESPKRKPRNLNPEYDIPISKLEAQFAEVVNIIDDSQESLIEPSSEAEGTNSVRGKKAIRGKGKSSSGNSVPISKKLGELEQCSSQENALEKFTLKGKAMSKERSVAVNKRSKSVPEAAKLDPSSANGAPNNALDSVLSSKQKLSRRSSLTKFTKMELQALPATSEFNQTTKIEAIMKAEAVDGKLPERTNMKRTNESFQETPVKSTQVRRRKSCTSVLGSDTSPLPVKSDMIEASPCVIDNLLPRLIDQAQLLRDGLSGRQSKSIQSPAKKQARNRSRTKSSTSKLEIRDSSLSSEGTEYEEESSMDNLTPRAKTKRKSITITTKPVETDPAVLSASSAQVYSNDLESFDETSISGQPKEKKKRCRKRNKIKSMEFISSETSQESCEMFQVLDSMQNKVQRQQQVKNSKATRILLSSNDSSLDSAHSTPFTEDSDQEVINSVVKMQRFQPNMKATKVQLESTDILQFSQFFEPKESTNFSQNHSYGEDHAQIVSAEGRKKKIRRRTKSAPIELKLSNSSVGQMSIVQPNEIASRMLKELESQSSTPKQANVLQENQNMGQSLERIQFEGTQLSGSLNCAQVKKRQSRSRNRGGKPQQPQQQQQQQQQQQISQAASLDGVSKVASEEQKGNTLNGSIKQGNKKGKVQTKITELESLSSASQSSECTDEDEFQTLRPDKEYLDSLGLGIKMGENKIGTQFHQALPVSKKQEGQLDEVNSLFQIPLELKGKSKNSQERKKRNGTKSPKISSETLGVIEHGPISQDSELLKKGVAKGKKRSKSSPNILKSCNALQISDTSQIIEGKKVEVNSRLDKTNVVCFDNAENSVPPNKHRKIKNQSKISRLQPQLDSLGVSVTPDASLDHQNLEHIGVLMNHNLQTDAHKKLPFSFCDPSNSATAVSEKGDLLNSGTPKKSKNVKNQNRVFKSQLKPSNIVKLSLQHESGGLPEILPSGLLGRKKKKSKSEAKNSSLEMEAEGTSSKLSPRKLMRESEVTDFLNSYLAGRGDGSRLNSPLGPEGRTSDLTFQFLPDEESHESLEMFGLRDGLEADNSIIKCKSKIKKSFLQSREMERVPISPQELVHCHGQEKRKKKKFRNRTKCVNAKFQIQEIDVDLDSSNLQPLALNELMQPIAFPEDELENDGMQIETSVKKRIPKFKLQMLGTSLVIQHAENGQLMKTSEVSQISGTVSDEMLGSKTFVKKKSKNQTKSSTSRPLSLMESSPIYSSANSTSETPGSEFLSVGANEQKGNGNLPVPENGIPMLDLEKLSREERFAANMDEIFRCVLGEQSESVVTPVKRKSKKIIQEKKFASHESMLEAIESVVRESIEISENCDVIDTNESQTDICHLDGSQEKNNVGNHTEFSEQPVTSLEIPAKNHEISNVLTSAVDVIQKLKADMESEKIKETSNDLVTEKDKNKSSSEISRQRSCVETNVVGNKEESSEQSVITSEIPVKDFEISDVLANAGDAQKLKSDLVTENTKETLNDSVSVKDKKRSSSENSRRRRSSVEKGKKRKRRISSSVEPLALSSDEDSLSIAQLRTLSCQDVSETKNIEAYTPNHNVDFSQFNSSLNAIDTPTKATALSPAKKRDQARKSNVKKRAKETKPPEVTNNLEDNVTEVSQCATLEKTEVLVDEPISLSEYIKDGVFVDEDTLPISKFGDPVFMKYFRKQRELLENENKKSCDNLQVDAANKNLESNLSYAVATGDVQFQDITGEVADTSNKVAKETSILREDDNEFIDEPITKCLRRRRRKEEVTPPVIGRERSARITRWNFSYEEMYTSSDVGSESDSQEFEMSAPEETNDEIPEEPVRRTLPPRSTRMASRRNKRSNVRKSRNMRLNWASSKYRKMCSRKRGNNVPQRVDETSPENNQNSSIEDPTNSVEKEAVNEMITESSLEDPTEKEVHTDHVMEEPLTAQPANIPSLEENFSPENIEQPITTQCSDIPASDRGNNSTSCVSDVTIPEVMETGEITACSLHENEQVSSSPDKAEIHESFKNSSKNRKAKKINPKKKACSSKTEEESPITPSSEPGVIPVLEEIECVSGSKVIPDSNSKDLCNISKPGKSNGETENYSRATRVKAKASKDFENSSLKETPPSVCHDVAVDKSQTCIQEGISQMNSSSNEAEVHELLNTPVKNRRTRKTSPQKRALSSKKEEESQPLPSSEVGVIPVLKEIEHALEDLCNIPKLGEGSEETGDSSSAAGVKSLGQGVAVDNGQTCIENDIKEVNSSSNEAEVHGSFDIPVKNRKAKKVSPKKKPLSSKKGQESHSLPSSEAGVISVFQEIEPISCCKLIPDSNLEDLCNISKLGECSEETGNSSMTAVMNEKASQGFQSSSPKDIIPLSSQGVTVDKDQTCIEENNSQMNSSSNEAEVCETFNITVKNRKTRKMSPKKKAHSNKKEEESLALLPSEASVIPMLKEIEHVSGNELIPDTNLEDLCNIPKLGESSEETADSSSAVSVTEKAYDDSQNSSLHDATPSSSQDVAVVKDQTCIEEDNSQVKSSSNKAEDYESFNISVKDRKTRKMSSKKKAHSSKKEEESHSLPPSEADIIPVFKEIERISGSEVIPDCNAENLCNISKLGMESKETGDSSSAASVKEKASKDFQNFSVKETPPSSNQNVAVDKNQTCIHEDIGLEENNGLLLNPVQPNESSELVTSELDTTVSCDLNTSHSPSKNSPKEKIIPKFYCPICDKSFATARNLRKHKETLFHFIQEKKANDIPTVASTKNVAEECGNTGGNESQSSLETGSSAVDGKVSVASEEAEPIVGTGLVTVPDSEKMEARPELFNIGTEDLLKDMNVKEKQSKDEMQLNIVESEVLVTDVDNKRKRSSSRKRDSGKKVAKAMEPNSNSAIDLDTAKSSVLHQNSTSVPEPLPVEDSLHNLVNSVCDEASQEQAKVLDQQDTSSEILDQSKKSLETVSTVDAEMVGSLKSIPGDLANSLGWSLSEESMAANDLALLNDESTPINTALADNYETFSSELATQFSSVPGPLDSQPVQDKGNGWLGEQSLQPTAEQINWTQNLQGKEGEWSQEMVDNSMGLRVQPCQPQEPQEQQNTSSASQLINMGWSNEDSSQKESWTGTTKVPEPNWPEQQQLQQQLQQQQPVGNAQWGDHSQVEVGSWPAVGESGNWPSSTDQQQPWPGTEEGVVGWQAQEGWIGETSRSWLWPGGGGNVEWGPQQPQTESGECSWPADPNAAPYYGHMGASAGLGTIMDSVNQVLQQEVLPAPPTASSEYPVYPGAEDAAPSPGTAMSSLRELQKAMGATDEEMVLLQRLGERSVESNWALENTETVESASGSSKDKEEGPAAKTTPPVIATRKRNLPLQMVLGRPGRSPARDDFMNEYQDKEMVCPLCHRFFLGLPALQSHVSSAHNRDETSKSQRAANRTRSTITSLLSVSSKEGGTTGPRVLCPICRELLQDEASLVRHREESHSPTTSSDPEGTSDSQGGDGNMAAAPGGGRAPGADGLKTKMTAALGDLFDRALSNLMEKSRLAGAAKDSAGLSSLGLLQLSVKRGMALSDQPSTSRMSSALAKKCRQELVGRRRGSEDGKGSGSEVERPFACPICDDRFLILSTRNRHIARAHSNQDRSNLNSPISNMASTDDPSEDPTLDDLDSSWREASPADWGVEPTEGDSGVGSFLCSDCGINFETPQDVLQHRKLEHSGKDKPGSSQASSAGPGTNADVAASTEMSSRTCFGSDDNTVSLRREEQDSQIPEQELPGEDVAATEESASNHSTDFLKASSKTDISSKFKGICEGKVNDPSTSVENDVASESARGEKAVLDAEKSLGIEKPSLISTSKDNPRAKDAAPEKPAKGRSGRGRGGGRSLDKQWELCEDGTTVRAKAEAALRELNSRKNRTNTNPASKWGLKFTVSDSPKEKPAKKEGEGTAPDYAKKSTASDKFNFPLVRKLPVGSTRFASLAEKKKKVLPIPIVKKVVPEAGEEKSSSSNTEVEVSNPELILTSDKPTFDVYEFEDEDSVPVGEVGFRPLHQRHPDDKTKETEEVDNPTNSDEIVMGLDQPSKLHENRQGEKAQDATEHLAEVAMLKGLETGSEEGEAQKPSMLTESNQPSPEPKTENKHEKSSKHRKSTKSSHEKSRRHSGHSQHLTEDHKKSSEEHHKPELLSSDFFNSDDNEVLVKKSKKDRSKKEHRRKKSHKRSEEHSHVSGEHSQKRKWEKESSVKKPSKVKKSGESLEVEGDSVSDNLRLQHGDGSHRKEGRKHTKKRRLPSDNSSDETSDVTLHELQRRAASKHEHVKKRHKKRRQRHPVSDKQHKTTHDSDDDSLLVGAKDVISARRYFGEDDDDETTNYSSDKGEDSSEQTKRAAARRRRTKSDLLISVFAKSKRNCLVNNSVLRSKSFLSVSSKDNDQTLSSSDESDVCDKRSSINSSGHKNRTVSSSEVI